MFKSLFLKYVSAFMAIMVLSFIVIVIVTSTAIGRYSGEEKKETMQTAALSAKAYVELLLDGEATDAQSIILDKQENIQNAIGNMIKSSDDITLLVVDTTGQVLAQAGNENNVISYDKPLPSGSFEMMSQGGEYSSVGKSDGMFENMQVVYAVDISNSDSDARLAVFVCSDSIMMRELWEVIIRTVMGSVLWVLLAALMAVYFISERVIAPLREISSAAKRFASGKFDVRVPVRGSDEVAELAVAFNNMAESLDNYDNMRNTFMSNVSHDLRSPMTSISGFIDGILDGVIPPEQHKYYLHIVSNEIHRLSRLVVTLLDLSRIQAGERKFIKTQFDICEMARQILISFEQKIDAKKLEVSFDIQEDRMNAFADRDAIYQVLYNLCDNAVKFADEGGELRIGIKKIKGRKLLVEVYNDGQGIARGDINYIFERFYKSDKSRGLNKNGSGLGLFISKTIMDAHDEKIWVESEYGKNCCFRFTLETE